MRNEISSGIAGGLVTAITVGFISAITTTASDGGLIKLMGGVSQEDLEELGKDLEELGARLDEDDLEIMEALVDLGTRLDKDDIKILEQLQNLEEKFEASRSE